jgi:hypothetical protein
VERKGRTELVLDELLERLHVLDSSSIELVCLTGEGVAFVAVSVLGGFEFRFELGSVLLALLRLHVRGISWERHSGGGKSAPWSSQLRRQTASSPPP